jgi:hypothetical protein
MIISNDGKTTARRFHPELRYGFARADIPFKPDYTASDPLGRTPPGNVSELNPGAHTTLISTSTLNLVHQHDVDAVMTGRYHLYIYGKVSYIDILNISHEYHLCRFYQFVEGADPLMLGMCETYNETR